MVRFTVTNRSGSMIRQLMHNVYCWLAEVRLAGPQVCFEREAEVRICHNRQVVDLHWHLITTLEQLD